MSKNPGDRKNKGCPWKKTASGNYIVPVMLVNRIVGRVEQDSHIICYRNGTPIPYKWLKEGGNYEIS